MNRTYYRFLILLFLCLTLPLPLLAQEARLLPEKQTRLEAAVGHFMAANRIPGASIAIVENGAVEWSAGFGMADLEGFVPASSQTLYRLGSISKPITSTAAMVLWQEHKLDLDAPVQKYCPAFPQKNVVMTTRQVLGHLAGIRHYKAGSQDDLEYGNTRHFDDTIQSGLKFFADDPLLSRPGTEFHYSTQGFTLAGCVIEGASGEKYVDFVTHHVLQPAGMAHTRTDDRFAIVPYRTRFYQKDSSGNILNADFLDSSYKVPGGGWLSTADDLGQFTAALLNNRFLQQPARDLMWTSLRTADGKETGYGLGWGTGTALGPKDVGHGGGQQGTSTFIMIIPERKVGVVVLMNIESADSGGLATALMKIVLGVEDKK